MRMDQIDFSTFYHANDAVAEELAALAAAGAFDRLFDIIARSRVKLLVTAESPVENERGRRLAEVVGALHPPTPFEPPGWNSDDYLYFRKTQTIPTSDGAIREVYMPDHVCPRCFNGVGNQLQHINIVCAECHFCW